MRLLDASDVCGEEVIAHELDIASVGEGRPGLPVILRKRVLEERQRILGNEAVVERSQFAAIVLIARLFRILVHIFEAEVVDTAVEEFTRGRVEPELDFARVAAVCDGCDQEVERFMGLADRGSKAALVADARCLRLVSSWILLLCLARSGTNLRRRTCSSTLSSTRGKFRHPFGPRAPSRLRRWVQS